MTSDSKGTVPIALRRCSALSQKAKALITVPETWGSAATLFPLLSAQRLAQQVQQEANWAPAVPAGLPWSYLNAQRCPVPLWTLIKAAQAELSVWLSSSSDTQCSHWASHSCAEFAAALQIPSETLCKIKAPNSLCITSRSITNSYLNYIWGLKRNANLM